MAEARWRIKSLERCKRYENLERLSIEILNSPESKEPDSKLSDIFR